MKTKYFSILKNIFTVIIVLGLSIGIKTLANPDLSVSCSVSPNLTTNNQQVDWTVSVTGGEGTINYNWTGSDSLSGTTQTITKIYTTQGTKTANVTATDSAGHTATATCSTEISQFMETQPAGNVDKWWNVLDSSADGSHLIAGSQSGSYISADYGTTWKLIGYYYSMSVSSNSSGSVLAFTEAEYMSLPKSYISVDYGETWRQTVTCSSIDMSSDGSRMICSAGDYIYTSSDYGVTWQVSKLAEPNKYWGFVSSSADGSHLVAGYTNSGRLFVSSNFGNTWSETQPAGNVDKRWKDVAMSDDGLHLIVSATFDNNLYISADYGATWKTARFNQTCNDLAISADGSNMFCLNDWENILYTSSDYGVTWTQNILQDKQWSKIASNADGSRLMMTDGARLYISFNLIKNNWKTARFNQTCNDLAISADGSNMFCLNDWENILYTSSDYGVTWTQNILQDKQWSKIASNADGSRLMMTDGARLYISSNFGNTWSETQPAGNVDKWWNVLDSSADGSHLIAGSQSGSYISADYGTTWKLIGYYYSMSVSSNSSGSVLAFTEAEYMSLPKSYISVDYGETWRQTVTCSSIDMSSDGSRMICSAGDYIYTSSDYGVTWQVSKLAEPNKYWGFVSSSADGSHLVAGYTNSGRLFVSSNFGNTWSETQPAGNVDKRWKDVAMSDDGLHLIVSATFDNNLYISAPIPLSSSCSVSPSPGVINKPVVWTVLPTGGSTIYTNYEWTGSDNLSGTTKTLSKTYTTVGTKEATVTVKDWTGATTTCSSSVDINLTEINNYTLTTNVHPTSSGSIIKSVGAKETSSTSFASGTVVKLSPEPAKDYVFLKWTGACRGYGSCTVTMDKNLDVTASFLPSGKGGGGSNPAIYNITATTSGEVTGTITGNESPYRMGAMAHLYASEENGYYVSSWTGCDFFYENRCDVSITDNVTVTAIYSPNPLSHDLNIIISPADGGTFIKKVDGVETTATNFTTGAIVNLTPVPASGYTFSSLTEGNTALCYDANNPCNVTMDSYKYLFGNFVLSQPEGGNNLDRGESCTNNNQCQSNLCYIPDANNPGVCAGPRDNGYPCDTDVDCDSGLCSDWVCAPNESAILNKKSLMANISSTLARIVDQIQDMFRR